METISAKNPATGEVLVQQNCFKAADVENLVRQAREIQKREWEPLTYEKRAEFLERAKNYLLGHMDEVAEAISKNNGKPLVESLSAEIIPIIQTISFATRKAARILQDQPIKIGMSLPTKRAVVHHAPLGVIGIISPWNYPLSTPLSEVVLGLMAGNAIILKPSDVTGYVNDQIAKIVASMNLPSGLFSMIHGKGDVGEALVKSGVDRIIVTGSVGTGKKVMAAAAATLTPVTLELGGKDCMIVFDDADIEIASAGAVVGGFYNNGQTCCSVERLIVQEKIADAFINKMKEKLAKLRIGPSSGFENDLGPVTFEGQKKTYLHQFQDHKHHGEKTLFGDADYDGQAPFVKPLIVETHDERELWKEETFGPVVAVKKFKTEEEAIQINNASRFGLTALIWTKDKKRAKRVAEKLRVGTVVINDGPFTNAVAALPWGGIGDSGFGRVHGEAGLKELCRATVICTDIAGQQKQFWWYPYSRFQFEFFKHYVRFLESKGIFAKIKALFNVIRSMKKMGPRL